MIVLDIGPRDADIMLVGEAPGREEEYAGKPFVGAAGNMLRHLCARSGIDYNACYVTNVMDVRPPGNSFSYFYDGKSPSRSLEDAWATLRAKIVEINPRVVIALGREPLRAICNKSSIKDYRGTWLSYKGIPVLPTYHPAYLLRVYGDHATVITDLRKAANDAPEVFPPMILRPTLDQVADWIKDTIKNYTRVSFDIETIGRSVRCLGFARGDCKHADRIVVSRLEKAYNVDAICIPFIQFKSSMMASQIGSTGIVTLPSMVSQSNGSSYWTEHDEVRVLDLVQSLFASGIEVVGQNSIGFDEPILQREFGLVIGNHHLDTMHAFHVLYPELPMSLNYLCSIFTNYPNYWADKDDTSDMSEWTYNSMDCIVTQIVSYKIEKELQEAPVVWSPQ